MERLNDSTVRRPISFNPLKTYTREEVAELFNTTREKIGELDDYGLIQGIKMGRRYIYSTAEIIRFLKEMKGVDLSNRLAIKDAAEERRVK